MTDTIKPALGKSGADIVASVRMSSDTLTWTAELFRCIKEIAEGDKAVARIRIATLAAIGDYLSEDFANMLDCEREAMDSALKLWEAQS